LLSERATLRPSRRRRRGFTVALVGADGAGKSTLSRALEAAQLPAPVKVVYMGVNLEASTLMLPTTRLLMLAKRARGARSDLVATPRQPRQGDPEAVGARRGRVQQGLKSVLRLAVWSGEEALRHLVSGSYTMLGRIVVYDRHFYADYFETDVRHDLPRSPAASIHGWLLEHVYPKPALTICLDATAEVLFRRKPESSVNFLAGRRCEYLRLGSALPNFHIVDVDRPLPEVLHDVVHIVRRYWEGGLT